METETVISPVLATQSFSWTYLANEKVKFSYPTCKGINTERLKPTLLVLNSAFYTLFKPVLIHLLFLPYSHLNVVMGISSHLLSIITNTYKYHEVIS